MSVEAVKWAFYESPMLLTEKGNPDTTARQVLSVLAEHANEYGTNSHPSPPRIRFATGLDERTIQRALGRLEAAGLIAKDGVVYTGTIRWKLDMSKVRPESEWAVMAAEAEEKKRTEAARVKAFRDRQSSVHREDGTDSASVRTDSLTVRTDAESVCTDAAPPEPPEPPKNHQGTIPGGTLPPDPLRTATPTGPRAEQTNSLPAVQDQPLDAVSNYRPHTREIDQSDVDDASREVRSTPEALFLAPQQTPTPLPTTVASPAGLCPHGQDLTRRTPDGQPRCKPCRQTPPVDPGTPPAPTPGPCGTPGCVAGTVIVGTLIQPCTGSHPAPVPAPEAPTTRGPAPDHRVWMTTPRRGLEAHRPEPTADTPFGSTGCGRSMRTGIQITARAAAARHEASWCDTCWPDTTEPS